MNSYMAKEHISQDQCGWLRLNRNDLQIIIAGLLISEALSILVFPVLHMLLQEFTSTDTAFATMDLILTLHSAVFISGLYICFYMVGKKYLDSFIVGILHYPFYLLIGSIILKHQPQFDIGIIISIMKDGFVCLLGASLAAATREIERYMGS